MVKVQLFPVTEETQSLVNEWLYNHRNAIEIIDIKCNNGYICIIYEPKEERSWRKKHM